MATGFCDRLLCVCYTAQSDAKKYAKKVPPQLIEDFLNGVKNPVSALMEFSAMCRLNTTFQECGLRDASIGVA